jgi:hypothetical protein
MTGYYGTLADVACNTADMLDDSISDGSYGYMCSGYGAATFFILLAFIASLVGMFIQTFNFRITYQLSSLALYALGLMCASAGLSQANCKLDVKTDSTKDLCNGYSAAGFFYFLTFVVFVAVAVDSRFETTHDRAKKVFIGGLACMSLSAFCFDTGLATSSCTLEDDGINEKANGAACNSYGFGAAMHFFCFVGMLCLLAWELLGKGIFPLWKKWTVWFFFTSLGIVGEYAAMSGYACEMGSGFDNTCDGYGAGTFFVLLISVCILVYFFFNQHFDENRINALLFFNFFLYMLGTGSGMGGQSKDSCDAGDDDLVSKSCRGLGFAAAMAIIFSFVSLAGVYVSYTGSYMQGGSADSVHADGDDKVAYGNMGDDDSSNNMAQYPVGDHQSQSQPMPQSPMPSGGNQSNFVSV